MGDRNTAVKFFNDAVLAANDKSNPTNIQVAYKLFVSAAYADPTLHDVFYEIGNANSDMQQIASSVAAYRRAIDCEMTTEQKAKCLVNLGWNLLRMDNDEEAFHVTKQALEIDDTVFLGHVNLSCILIMRGDVTGAVKHAFKAWDLSKDAAVEMSLAFALLEAGRYAEGLKHFERRFDYKLHQFLRYPYPRLLPEHRDGTVFLMADQGLGDTLSYARFVPALCARHKHVHACVQPELLRAFNYAFVQIPNITLHPAPCHFPQADYWTTFVSLPFALGLTDKEIREQADIELPVFDTDTAWKVTDRKLHIGIAWAGSPLNDIDRHRNIPLANFLDLYRVPGVQLYGLQVGDKAKDLHEQGCVALIQDLSPYIRDVADTVALLQHLDLVICCESALGHICGVAGRECVIPYSYAGKDYRLGPRGENVLWYKKHKIVNQGRDRKWEPVFEEINKILRKRMRDGRPSHYLHLP